MSASARVDLTDTVVEDYLERLLHGDSAGCLRLAQEQGDGLEGLRRVYLGLIESTQYQVGDLWEAGKVSVATEHVATATNTFVAVSSYAPLARAVVGGPKAVVACSPDEYHQLGGHLVSDLLEIDGWDVDFLGASMPLADLIGAIREAQPLAVGLSSALTQHLGNMQRAIRIIREELGSETPPIVVGGNAFRGEPDLWKKVGADRWARDATSAVELFREFRE